MTRILLADTLALLARHGRWAFAEFLALGLGLVTLESLIASGRLRAKATGEAAETVTQAFLDPFVLLHEALFTPLFALACLRIWASTTGTAPRAGAIARAYWPLLVLNLVSGYAAYIGLTMLFLPGIVIAALTTILTPAAVIEGRGWDALAHSIRATAPHLAPLALAWTLIVMPWLVLLVAASPDPEAARTAAPALLWARMLLPEIASAILATLALALTMATYRQLAEPTD